MANYKLFLFMIITLIGLAIVEGETNDINGSCKVSKCQKHGPEIRYPFRINNQPKHCGRPGFEVSCDHMNRTILQLPVHVDVVAVNIDYLRQTMDIIDPKNCFFSNFNQSINISASPFYDNEYYLPARYEDIGLFKCLPVETSEFITLVPCLSGSGYEIYISTGGYRLSDELTSCVKVGNYSSVPVSFVLNNRESVQKLFWYEPSCLDCERAGNWCTRNASTHERVCLRPPKTNAAKKRLILVLGGVLFIPALIALYFMYNSLKIMQEDQVKVQRFLKDYKALKPSRYSFHDIKKITNNFKEKLGVGAYGTVFKGKLSNEIFVAVKVLQSSLENGAEFIKEVGTMATIHHANVVRLIGFCADGIKQALIYEFCPNESLEKFIFSENSENNFLGWERLQYIALGIARGIEYLHQGCDRQILHFDIKPHNILLDHNFNPKITDFGLAKLCPKDQSKVSMTKARGTMGYIAPEVFSRNFGNVSNKSDVFSFGMLLLEMVGRRKYTDSTVQNSSRKYFPEIIYDRICRGKDIQEDSEIAKKIAIVGLWCIQWSPLDRPSMKTVIQMLEAKVEMLPMPANPFALIDGFTKQRRNFNIELDVITEEV